MGGVGRDLCAGIDSALGLDPAANFVVVFAVIIRACEVDFLEAVGDRLRGHGCGEPAFLGRNGEPAAHRYKEQSRNGPIIEPGVKRSWTSGKYERSQQIY